MGPRRAVVGSIVLRGPKAPRLAGRLSSNVRPHTAGATSAREHSKFVGLACALFAPLNSDVHWPSQKSPVTGLA